jgi:hypothetical protein
MKTFLAAALALAASPLVSAAGREVDGGIIAVRPIDAVAVVVAADRVSRTLTISDPGGKRVTFDVPPEVALDSIREGALLDVSYVEAEALTILKAGMVPTVMVQSVAVAPRAGRPAGLSVTPRRILGRIRDIDRKRRALTIIGADQRPVALNVAPVVDGFEQLEPGDSAEIEYTGALVLSAVLHDGGKPVAPQL